MPRSRKAPTTKSSFTQHHMSFDAHLAGPLHVARDVSRALAVARAMAGAYSKGGRLFARAMACKSGPRLHPLGEGRLGAVGGRWWAVVGLGSAVCHTTRCWYLPPLDISTFLFLCAAAYLALCISMQAWQPRRTRRCRKKREGAESFRATVKPPLRVAEFTL